MTLSGRKPEAAEFAGTAMLAASIVGSGIMGERLADGNAAVALLANSAATGATLLALILTFSRISGSHFNPVMTLAAVSQHEISWGTAAHRAAWQTAGALAGVVAANVMFGLPVFTASQHVRGGSGQVFAEIVATFGVTTVARLSSSPFAVAGYIFGAYWFTSSTSFANPAVTLARTLTDSFSGIQLTDAPAFIAAQFAGAAVAIVFCRWLTGGGAPTNAN